ncbi:MAG TPA: SH3 domain-containing protein [Bdellovibrionota bacterium]|nr:SH3 domain-containing protein [Bdellovibrionota bacterium]
MNHQSLSSILLIFSLLFPFFSLAAERMVVIDKPAQLRKDPSITAEVLPGEIPPGTVVDLLQTEGKAIQIGGIEGNWLEIQVDPQFKGWVFDQYLRGSGTSDAENYISKVISNLYYYRPGITSAVEELSKVPASKIFGTTTKYLPRHLNYIGYQLLAQQNKNAIPLLIEFMNPAYRKENEEDANYKFHWTILQLLNEGDFIVEAASPEESLSSLQRRWYEKYRSWWEKNGDRFSLRAPNTTLLSIFATIKANEDRAYRRSW